MDIILCGKYKVDTGEYAQIGVSPSTGEVVLISDTEPPRFLVNMLIDDPKKRPDVYIENVLKSHTEAIGIITSFEYFVILTQDKAKFYHPFEEEPYQTVTYYFEPIHDKYNIVEQM